MPLFGPPQIDSLKAKRDINGLLQALQHKDPRIRAEAAEALGEMAEVPKRQPRSEPEWRRPKPEPEWNMDEFSCRRVIEGLVGTLKDSEPVTRQAAMAALLRICFSPRTGFAAAAISAILALGDKATEEAFVEGVLRGGLKWRLFHFSGNLAMALDGPGGELYLGQSSPLAPRTIETIISSLVKSLPPGWSDNFEQDRSVGILRRTSHGSAIRPLFAVIADNCQLKQDRYEARETIKEKLFLVTILENVLRPNLTAIEDGILQEISDFTLMESAFAYEEVEAEPGLTLARTSRTGSCPVPTPGLNSLAQDELRRRAATRTPGSTPPPASR